MAHPNRYPVHEDAEKGQTYGGVCNITRCENADAVMWNAITYGLYCDSCAEDINRYAPSGEICFPVTQYPSAEAMDKMYRQVENVQRHRNYHPSTADGITITMSYDNRDDMFRPSGKQRARNAQKAFDQAEIHVMTRQLRRKLERQA